MSEHQDRYDPADFPLDAHPDADLLEPLDGVEIRKARVGRGLFATRDFPVNAVVGELDGVLVEGGDYGSNYAFDFDENLSLEPDPPFRFLNHSCDPNCEYIWSDDDQISEIREARRLYIATLRNVYAGEELTLDYGWPAESAIRCLCGAVKCRGWVVCEEELELLCDGPIDDVSRGVDSERNGCDNGASKSDSA